MQHILHVWEDPKPDPKIGTIFRTVEPWDWSNKIMNMDVEFGKPQDRGYYKNRYPKNQLVAYVDLVPQLDAIR